MKSSSSAIAAVGACFMLYGPSSWASASSTCSKSAPTTATCITSTDFLFGTLIIDQPGDYRLCEDIEFKPNPYSTPVVDLDAFVPDFNKYDKNAYGMGFFSAISIAASGVNLYLDCHTLEQSPEHALLQRFYANIELASSPFLPMVGPHNFGDNFVPATDVKIIGPGTLGRSSHHGIHGNENSNVIVRGVTFENFEVGAVSLNNVDNLVIEDCKVVKNRHDIPVIGSWSAAILIRLLSTGWIHLQVLKRVHLGVNMFCPFILSRPYLDALQAIDYEMDIQGLTVTAAQAYNDLTASLEAVYEDVMTDGYISEANHPEEYALFNNIHHVIDGPCYAFNVHGKGPAVGGIGFTLNEDKSVTSSNIIIQNNHIQNIKCWTNEIPAAVVDGVVQNDARGAILQFVNTFVDHDDDSFISIDSYGHYRPNVVANAQIIVAKAIHDGVLLDSPVLQTGVNTISSEIIEWASSTAEVFEPNYRCNGDSMHHVSKGVMIIRVEDTEGFVILGNTITDIKNLSPAPFSGCTDFHLGASTENSNEQQGGNIRAISVSAVTGFDNNGGTSSLIKENTIVGASSANANIIIGIDIQGDSNRIEVDSNSVDLIGADNDISDSKRRIACRCRENVAMICTGDNNNFVQDSEFLFEFCENYDVLQDVHKNMPLSLNDWNEWEFGGCPFARDNKRI